MEHWYAFSEQGGRVLRDIVGDTDGVFDFLGANDWRTAGPTGRFALDFNSAGASQSELVYLPNSDQWSGKQGAVSVWAKSNIFDSARYKSPLGRNLSGNLAGDMFFLYNPNVNAMRFGIQDGTNTSTVDANEPFLRTEWTHYLGVWDESRLEFFINGVSQGTAAGIELVPHVSGTRIAIGHSGYAFNDPNENWEGSVSDVRWYSRSLNASEAIDLYQASRTGYQDQFKRRSFPVGVTPTPTESHPSNGLIRLRQNAQPSYKAGYAKSASESAYPELWDGLVGSWMPSFGATGGTLLDVSGKRNGGTLTNMELDSDWVVSEKGIAINFDGTNEYIDDIGGVADYSFVQNTLSFAIAFTFKVTELGTRDVIWGNTGSSTEKGFFTQVTTDGEYWFNAFNSVGESTADRTVISVKSATGKIAAGQWHTAIVVGYPIGNSAKVFIDGIESTVIVNSHSGYSTGNSSRTLNIGRTNYTSNADNMIGQFTQFAIWDRPLGESEIQTITADPLAPFRQRRSIPFGVTAAPAVGFNHWYARQARTHRIVGSGVHV